MTLNGVTSQSILRPRLDVYLAPPVAQRCRGNPKIDSDFNPWFFAIPGDFYYVTVKLFRESFHDTSSEEHLPAFTCEMPPNPAPLPDGSYCLGILPFSYHHYDSNRPGNSNSGNCSMKLGSLISRKLDSSEALSKK